MMPRDTAITVCNGKYTFKRIEGDWRVHVLRYGEEWLVIEAGHKAIFALMDEIEDLQSRLESYQSEPPAERPD